MLFIPIGMSHVSVEKRRIITHDSFIYNTWLIHSRHDSFTRDMVFRHSSGTWLPRSWETRLIHRNVYHEEAMSRTNTGRVSHEWVMSLIKESFLARMSNVLNGWVMCYIRMRNILYMNESCRSWMSHVSDDWVMSQIYQSTKDLGWHRRISS